MRIASVNNYYCQRVTKLSTPVQKKKLENSLNQQTQVQSVNFGGNKWKVAETITWGILGFIAGGPVGAIVGAAAGLGVGAATDEADP